MVLACDGACALAGPRAHLGGWAFVLQSGERVQEQSGQGPYPTTNGVMELTACLHGLRALKVPCAVTIISDAEYLLRGLCGLEGEPAWLDVWAAKGWRTSAGKKLANRPIWEDLANLRATHWLLPLWVKGHTPPAHWTDAHRLQARCDRLAVAEAVHAYEMRLAGNLSKSILDSQPEV